MSARDLAPILWSIAKIKRQPPLWWMRQYEAVLVPRLNELSVQARPLAARSGMQKIAFLSQSILEMVSRSLKSWLQLQEMVTVLYGYGSLRHRLPRLLFRSLLQLICTRWRHLGPRGAANALVAFARLRMPPHAGWVKGLLRQTLDMKRPKERLTPSAVSGTEDEGPGAPPPAPETFPLPASSADCGTSGSHDQLTFEGAARCLWALGTLGIDPGVDVAQVLIRVVEWAAPEIEDLIETGEAHLNPSRKGREDGNVGVSDVSGATVHQYKENDDDRLGDDHEWWDYRVWHERLLDQARWGYRTLGYDSGSTTMDLIAD